MTHIYHPDYGTFDDQFRLRVLLDSVTHGIEEAAKMNGISHTAVYQWRKRYVEVFQDIKWKV